MAEGAGREVGRISIKVTPNLEGFREKIAAELREIEAQDHNIHVKVEVDGGHAKEQMGALLAELQAMADKHVHVKVHVDVDHDRIRNLLEGIGSRYRLGGGRGGVARDVEDVAEGAAGVAAGGAGAAGRAANTSVPLAGALLQPAAIVAAVASFISPALALLAGGLTALPGLITAVAAPIGVFALGMGGLKKAIVDADLGTENKKGKLGLAGGLKNLQTTVSDELEHGFTPVFRSLADLLPTVTTGFKGIAQGLSTMAQGFASNLASPENTAKFKEMFANIGTAISVATPGIQSFTNGMTGLANSLISKLPTMATVFNGWGNSFSNWVSKITAPGADGKSMFDNAMHSLSSTLQPFVGGIVDMFQHGFEKLSDPAFGASMAQFMGNLRGLIDQLMPELDKLFTGISQFVQDIATISHQIDGVLEELGLKKHVDHPTGGGGPKPPAPGSPGAKPGSGGKDDPYAPEGPSAQQQAIIDKQGGGLAHDLPGLVHQSKEGWKDWFGLVQDVPDSIDRAGASLKSNVKKNFLDGLKEITDFFAGPNSISGKADAKFKGFLRNLIPGGDATAKADAPAGPVVTGPKVPGMAPGAPVPGATPVQVPGGQATQQAAEQAKKAAGDVTAAFQAIPGQLGGIWQQIGAGAQAAFQGLVQAATTAVQAVLAAVKTIPAGITAALSGVYTAGLNAGQQLGAGMAAGIAAGAGAAIEAARALAQGVEAAGKGHLQISSPSKLFHDMGVNTAEGMANGLDEGTGSAVDRAKTLAKSISDATNNGIEFNKSAVGNQIKELQDEIKVEQDNLRVQEDGLPGKGNKAARQGIKDQMNDLKTANDVLKSDADTFGLKPSKDKKGKDGKGGDSYSEAANMITAALAKSLDGMKAVAMGNVNQFEKDVGMSGNGAIETIADQGLGFLMQTANGLAGSVFGGKGGKSQGGDTHFHVNNTDEALAIHDNEKNKKALQFAGR